MDSTSILAACETHLETFKSTLSDCAAYENKGIFHSELLAFVSIASTLGCDQIIESGRARGQSTEVIGRFFNRQGVRFESIEFDRWSPDVQTAAARLADLEGSITLHFGDAVKLVPRLADGSSIIVLIDGPKGFEALALAGVALGIPAVKAVAIHDLPQDSQAERHLTEDCGLATWFTDEPDFVDRFQQLDDPCWQALKAIPETADWAPYRRGTQSKRSYSSTLGFVFPPGSAPQRREAAEALTRRARRMLREHRSKGSLVGRIAPALPSALRQSRIYRRFAERVSR